MKLFLFFTLTLFGASATPDFIQNPCTTGTCGCVANMTIGGTLPALNGDWKSLSPVGSSGVDAEYRLLPKMNSANEEDALHNGVCSKPLEGCECLADPCGYDFSLEIKITDDSGVTGTPKVGLSNPSGGTPLTEDLVYDATVGQWSYSSGFIHRSLSCGNPSVTMKLVLGNGTEVYGKANIQLECPDCPGNGS